MNVVDCIVVGAGASGLAAATALHAQGKSVVVLEARDRIGGRLFATPAPQNTAEKSIDLGGQWVGPSQHRVLALAKKHQLELIPQYEEGKSLLHFGGSTQAYSGTIPPLPLYALLDLQQLLWKIDSLSRTVPPTEPWNAPKAVELDSQTVETWIQRNAWTSRAAAYIRLAVRAVLTSEPAEVSLLMLLFYVRCAGNIMALLDVKNGAQEQRVVAGLASIPKVLASMLPTGMIHLSEHVTGILSETPDHVTVETSKGQRYTAKRVIVAIPPAITGRIRFLPPLPSRRTQLMQRMPMGSCIKAHIVYEHAFWRSAGFSGECVCEGLPLLTLFDNCDPERDYYALMGFFSSENARIWGERTQEERKNAAIDQVYKLFNVEEARWPKAYVDCNWCQEEWSGGAYTGVMGPGTCTQFGQSLCQPVGRVHWAGTETASEWNGYVEGALQAGERAASEVLQYL